MQRFFSMAIGAIGAIGPKESEGHNNLCLKKVRHFNIIIQHDKFVIVKKDTLKTQYSNTERKIYIYFSDICHLIFNT